jgi:hypothetical protein
MVSAGPSSQSQLVAHNRLRNLTQPDPLESTSECRDDVHGITVPHSTLYQCEMAVPLHSTTTSLELYTYLLVIVENRLGEPGPTVFDASHTGRISSVDVLNSAGQVISDVSIVTESGFPYSRTAVNAGPTASAGPDQRVACTSPQGTPVNLDGSSSSDPDNNPLTFLWTGPFLGGANVTGPKPVVTLALGNSSIVLNVSDGSATAQSSVRVTIYAHVLGLQFPLAALAPDGTMPPLPDRAFPNGRVLPLKLQLFCATNLLTDSQVSPPRIVDLTRTGVPVAGLETLDLNAGMSNDNTLLFRFADGNWIYNLDTSALKAGTYLLRLEMPDGLRYGARLVLK